MRFKFDLILTLFYTRHWVKNESKLNCITPQESSQVYQGENLRLTACTRTHKPRVKITGSGYDVPSNKLIKLFTFYLLLQEVSSPTKSAAAAVEEIPVEKVDLPVQLHIPGLASADQYFNISRDSSVSGGAKKKKKKDKKGKKRRESEATTDDGAEQVSL